jgi:dihydroneopterin aldolase
MSFAEIQDKIAATYAGSGAVALDTYAGSMAKLSVATSNAAETIGGALLDGIIAVTGNDGIDGLIKDIDTLAKGFGFLITQVTGAIGALSGQDARKAFSTGYYTGGGRAGGSSVFKPKGMGNVALTGGSNMDTQKSSLAAAKKAEDAAKKRAADLLAATKKSAALQAAAAKKADLATKNQIALTKAAAAFDLKQISIANAIKETYDKDTKLRLLAMQAIESDNGEAAIKYLEQLDILQKAVQTAKLNGITTISDASLHALNVELLTELQNIDASKMKDADKEAAKMAAFARYNDAIIKEGGLAETSYYNERTQIELTYIAKRAALDNYGAASETLRKIIESEELSLIKTVGTAQYAADLARYNALQDYIRLLGEAKAAAATLATDIYTQNLFGDLPSSGAADPNLGGDGSGGTDPNADPNLGGDYGSPSYPDLSGGGGDYGSPSYPDAMSNPNGITVIVNTGATLGTEDTIVEAVQTAIQTLNRRGSNTSYAGAI